ncbi:hypothetical protein ACIP98_35540 [Streptomyces sp. NPDC088354]|uniref:hypothetical protein n=1 Tax=Streptomyces sp. NPDC088354 TaxID=3365856 RepID=UPI0037F21EDB
MRAKICRPGKGFRVVVPGQGAADHLNAEPFVMDIDESDRRGGFGPRSEAKKRPQP